MRVEIIFHGPFRVGTGTARAGLNETVDPGEFLPPSSLKGLMRASTVVLLPKRPDLVTAVFGYHATRDRDRLAGLPEARRERLRRASSPWHWGPVTFDPKFDPKRNVRPRARVAIDPETGAAREDHLVIAEEVWAKRAHFEVTQRAHLEPAELCVHQAVLACAAAGVHALGADRRRGLGWVTLTPTDPAVDDTVLTILEDVARG